MIFWWCESSILQYFSQLGLAFVVFRLPCSVVNDRNNTRRKILLWFTGSEVSEQSSYASLLWFPGKMEHYSGQNVWRMRLFTELTHILQRQICSMHVCSTRPQFPQVQHILINSKFKFINALLQFLENSPQAQLILGVALNDTLKVHV